MSTNTDIVRIFERLLLVQFGSTGEGQSMSTLTLEGMTLFKDGNQINACYNNGHPPFMLESFPSEPLAASAFKRLQTALTRYAMLRRASTLGKGVIKWVVGPAVLCTLVLALNMVATRALEPTSSVASAAAASMLPLPTNVEAINLGMGSTAQSPPPLPTRSAAELAKAMSDGVKAKKYSLQIAQGSQGTIYIFSDPSCGHCQELEGELEKLARDFTIHIFPVSVIGGDESVRRVAKIMCQKPSARAPLWKQVVAGADPRNEQCKDGLTAVAANNEIFRMMGFAGTPAIISGTGEVTPDSVGNTADEIKRWMSTRERR